MSQPLTITISGPQGSGKTRLGQHLIEALNLHPAEVVRIYPAARGAFHSADGTDALALIGQMLGDGPPVMLGTKETEVRDPQPPIGPLTSTEHLKPGDLVRRHADAHMGMAVGDIDAVREVASPTGVRLTSFNAPKYGNHDPANLSFIGRPDADGWIQWTGTENPVPGKLVELRIDTDPDTPYPAHADDVEWGHRPHGPRLAAFRIVEDLTSEPWRPSTECTAARPANVAAADEVRAAVEALNAAVERALSVGVTSRFIIETEWSNAGEKSTIRVRTTAEV